MKSFLFLVSFLFFSGSIPAPVPPEQYLAANNIKLAATDFDSNVQMPPDTSGQSLYTLGVKKPDGSCYVTQVYAKSLDDAITSVTNSCQDCTIDDITGSSYSPGAPDFQQFCLAAPGT